LILKYFKEHQNKKARNLSVSRYWWYLP